MKVLAGLRGPNSWSFSGWSLPVFPVLAVLALLVLSSLSGCATRSSHDTQDGARGGASVGARPASNEPGDPDRRAQVRLELASLYFGRGQYTTALDEVRQALAARPDLPEGHGLRGLILAAMGEVSAAEDSLRRAIQLAPTDGGALHNHAWFLCQQKRYAEAERQFNAALALPQYRDGVRTLLAQGVCQARAGRLQEAERSLLRSFELDPANPVTAFNLSEVLLQRGEPERARFYVLRIHAVPELVSAQSLWLLARIENRLGNRVAARAAGEQLRDRFPQSAETLRFERGTFDD